MILRSFEGSKTTGLKSDHFDAKEWTSTDGVPYPLDQLDENGQPWWQTRLSPLIETLEVIRAAAGNEALSVTPNGGFRSKAHQQAIVDRSPDSEEAGLVASADTSQHPQGRAADVRHHRLQALELHNLILKLYGLGKLPHLGGLGLYPQFCHVDVRPRPGGQGGANDGHLARWGGARHDNSATAAAPLATAAPAASAPPPAAPSAPTKPVDEVAPARSK